MNPDAIEKQVVWLSKLSAKDRRGIFFGLSILIYLLIQIQTPWMAIACLFPLVCLAAGLVISDQMAEIGTGSKSVWERRIRPWYLNKLGMKD